MQQALLQAQKALELDEVPVGAIITYRNKIIAATCNQVETANNPTGHAEMLAIQQACQHLKSPRLTDCTLYVTLEPCAMCAQAIAHARIPKLVFGAYDPKGGGVEHGSRIFQQPTCHHQLEVVGGVMEQECSAILKQFFQQKRLK